MFWSDEKSYLESGSGMVRASGCGSGAILMCMFETVYLLSKKKKVKLQVFV
jgi:hypothetical protein